MGKCGDRPELNGSEKMKKIKKCPFCGGYAKLKIIGSGYAVKCNECGATSRTVYKNAGVTPAMVQNMAIDLWNERAV